MLKIFNTLTKEKEIFTPVRPDKVSMYVCGITVYDYCHIGHARSMIAFDMVARYFRYRGYEVNYVHNITDVDDKIIARANENKEAIHHLTERFIAAMHEDEKNLAVLPPTQEPRATNHIEGMIAMIQTLIDTGFAYVGTNGDVFYQVSQFSGYGKLSHQDIDSLRSGERITIQDAKQDPLDFVLWKLAKLGEPSWDSPWGKGRPGWHIECSVMAKHCLGKQFDIHGGGLDLQFPHHENEIAQSEAANACHFANIWMHAGLVQINKEKMSKSLGNFFTIREVLQKFSGEAIRYFMLASHYRSPISYSEDNLHNAQTALERFYMALRDLPIIEAEKNTSYEQRFVEAMDDDFNTPVAIAVLFDIVRDINKVRETDKAEASQLAAILRYLGSILGILQQDPATVLQGEVADTQQIENLIAERTQAKQDKNWARADSIRDELKAQGIILEDKGAETIWRRG